jgi:phosphatidylserine/phosphatidylglycerophosphate/cardiolipin synthase-like enzyme
MTPSPRPPRLRRSSSARRSRVRQRLGLALVLPVVAVALTSVSASPAQATPDHFNPRKGATFNNPYGGKVASHRILHQLVRTINSVRPGHKIRIASWNFRSNVLADALIRAHRRGVSVRVLMDYGNWNPDLPNATARRTHRALALRDKHRAPDMTSWLRRCRGSCRGRHGIAHTKFYLFDQVQKTKDVVMYGSANATLLAATIQWNDLYTFTNTPAIYDEFSHVFDQMRKDKAVRQGYLSYQHGRNRIDFYPYTGKGTTKDPVLSVLDQVRCTGATRHTGIHGHTKIRIAQTATYGNRGLALAQRLATMRKRGCNIRLVYAMFGTQALKILRAAKVPLTHLAYDADCNGIYDKYVHLKSMTVSGVYGKNTHARYTWNGSANWTPVSLASDEVVGVIQRGDVTREYSNWIDYLFTHVPPSWRPNHCAGVVGTVSDGGTTDRSMAAHGLSAPQPVYRSVAARARALHVDPYAIIRKDL